MQTLKHSMPTLLLIIASLVGSQVLVAAPREAAGGSAKAVAKLQAMVQCVTAERDAAKAETAKVNADLEQARAELKKQSEQLVTLEEEKVLALQAGDKLSGELTAQKTSTDAALGRLNSTSEKLRAMTEQYEAQVKANQLLNTQHNQLQTVQKTTASELTTCEAKNLKMYETTKAMIDQYQVAQNKSLLDKVVESEPLFKIDDVETETMLQDYQDKLNKQKYKDKSKTN